MATLKAVVDRISLIAFTQQITKAMQMVSVAKLHKIQQMLYPLKAYTTQYSALLQAALQNIDEEHLTHALSQKKRGQRLLWIVVASNRGLCGAFNKNILKAVDAQITTRMQDPSATGAVLVIGKRAYQFFKKSHIPVIDRYVDLLAKSNDQVSTELTTYCIEAFENNSYTEIALAYTAFKNSAQQEVTIIPFLPFLPNLKVAVSPPLTRPLYYRYEPSQSLLIAQLIPEILKHQVMHMLVESSASEHAARIATMSQATSHAEELLKELRIRYNRSRQALITRSLSEITSGAEALAGA